MMWKGTQYGTENLWKDFLAEREKIEEALLKGNVRKKEFENEYLGRGANYVVDTENFQISFVFIGNDFEGVEIVCPNGDLYELRGDEAVKALAKEVFINGKKEYVKEMLETFEEVQIEKIDTTDEYDPADVDDLYYYELEKGLYEPCFIDDIECGYYGD